MRRPVLTILPLAVAGAVLGLVVSGKSLNLFSMIGLLLPASDSAE